MPNRARNALCEPAVVCKSSSDDRVTIQLQTRSNPDGQVLQIFRLRVTAMRRPMGAGTNVCPARLVVELVPCYLFELVGLDLRLFDRPQLAGEFGWLVWLPTSLYADENGPPLCASAVTSFTNSHLPRGVPSS